MNKTRFFFDTEFIEDGITIDLISIGIITEDGKEFYEISNEFNKNNANKWVQENVIKYLPDENEKPRLSNEEIKNKLVKFVGNLSKEEIEFWAYFGDYDWVLLCQLFGAMIDLPDNWPMFAYDIKQEAMRLGNIKIDEPIGEHDALVDAKWNLKYWKFLKNIDRINSGSLFL